MVLSAALLRPLLLSDGLPIAFMVSKVLDKRADALSGVVVDTLDDLCSVLTKIGFTRLYLEHYRPGTGCSNGFYSILTPHLLPRPETGKNFPWELGGQARFLNIG